MSRAISITRDALSAAELRHAAQRSRDGRVSCRLLALAAVLDGASRAEAAAAHGMDRQTLRDWVHRYNTDGIAGLSDRPRSGRRAALTEEQREAVKALVLAGPDPARDGGVRWRCIDLRAQSPGTFR